MKYFEVLNDIRSALQQVNIMKNLEVQAKQRENALRDINDLLENCGV